MRYNNNVDHDDSHNASESDRFVDENQDEEGEDEFSDYHNGDYSESQTNGGDISNSNNDSAMYTPVIPSPKGPGRNESVISTSSYATNTRYEFSRQSLANFATYVANKNEKGTTKGGIIKICSSFVCGFLFCVMIVVLLSTNATIFERGGGGISSSKLDATTNPLVGDDLIQPKAVFSDENAKLLDTVIELDYGNIVTAAHEFQSTRLFNGTLPGPTIYINPGDTLKILYKNKLVEQTTTQNIKYNDYSYPDRSNLHFHGAHVSGELPSDDVTHIVEPSTEYQYISNFPTNHMPGTHWIHPHYHGSSSLQIGGGAASVLIVQDPIGYLPNEISSAQEIVLMIQLMNFVSLGNIQQLSGDTKLQISRKRGFGGNFRLVNGQVR